MSKLLLIILTAMSLTLAAFFLTAGDALSGALPAKPVSITSTSALTDPKLDYSAKNLMDLEQGKCWCEGARGDGIGESFTITFDREVEIDRFYIFNGVGIEKFHEKNNRVKQFVINGTAKAEIDEYGVTGPFGWRMVEMSSKLKAKQFTFTIAAVHSGTAWKDTCVAEISFENPNLLKWMQKPANFPVPVIHEEIFVSLKKDGTLGGPGIWGHQCSTPFLGGTWKLKGDAVEISFEYQVQPNCGDLEAEPQEGEWETHTRNATVRTLLTDAP
jgi:hypothetical protein